MKGALTDHDLGLIPSTWMLGGMGQIDRAQAGLGLCEFLVQAGMEMIPPASTAPPQQERQPVGPTSQPLAS